MLSASYKLEIEGGVVENIKSHSNTINGFIETTLCAAGMGSSLTGYRPPIILSISIFSHYCSLDTPEMPAAQCFSFQIVQI